MSINTITAPVLAPVLPELDPALGDTLGDELLLGAASHERATKVAGAKSASFQARAWTYGGNVD